MVRNLVVLFSMVVAAMTSQAAVKVEKTEYNGWKNCYRVTNGQVELIVTGDVGPRVIRFGFVGGQNLFKEFPDQLGKSAEEKFQLRGGDRVWKAPEDPVATWAPDNVPVDIQVTSTGLIAREPIEPLTKLQKEIEVSMEASGAEVKVSHRIRNHSLFPLEFSAWALTMMAPGGVAVAGFPPRGHHPANLPKRQIFPSEFPAWIGKIRIGPHNQWVRGCVPAQWRSFSRAARNPTCPKPTRTLAVRSRLSPIRISSKSKLWAQ